MAEAAEAAGVAAPLLTFDAWLDTIGAPDLTEARAAAGYRTGQTEDGGDYLIRLDADTGEGTRIRGEAAYETMQATEADWRARYGVPVGNAWSDAFGWAAGPAASRYATTGGQNWLGGALGIVAPGTYPSIYGGATVLAETPLTHQQNDAYLTALSRFESKYGKDTFQLSPDQVTYDPATQGLTIKTPRDGYAGQYIADPSKVIFDPEFGLVAPRDQFGAQGMKGVSTWKGGLGEALTYFLALVTAGTALTAFLAPSVAVTTGAAGAALNAQGLALMAGDAGLSGVAAEAFIASGGTLGSTAAASLLAAPLAPVTNIGADIYNLINAVDPIDAIWQVEQWGGPQAFGQSTMLDALKFLNFDPSWFSALPSLPSLPAEAAPPVQPAAPPLEAPPFEAPSLPSMPSLPSLPSGPLLPGIDLAAVAATIGKAAIAPLVALVVGTIAKATGENNPGTGLPGYLPPGYVPAGAQFPGVKTPSPLAAIMGGSNGTMFLMLAAAGLGGVLLLKKRKLI